MKRRHTNHCGLNEIKECRCAKKTFPLLQYLANRRRCTASPVCCGCACENLFTVTFETGGGMPVPPPQTVAYGGRVARPADPVRVDYVFAGWYRTPDFTGEAWDFDADTVAGNMTLFARWVSALGFAITFDAGGGMPVPPSQTVPYGGLITRPADPVRAGYIFTGWYSTPGLSVAPWNFDVDTVEGDMTLFARWILPT